MTVSWRSGVNTRVLRDSGSWKARCAFITDETRSGKQKRRRAHSMGRKVYPVKFHFTYTEYTAFLEWYTDVCLEGLNSFLFPKIGDTGTNQYGEYEFTEDGAPEFSNPSGKIIECTMNWQEV